MKFMGMKLNIDLTQKTIGCLTTENSYGKISACVAIPRSTIQSVINKFATIVSIETLSRRGPKHKPLEITTQKLCREVNIALLGVQDDIADRCGED